MITSGILDVLQHTNQVRAAKARQARSHSPRVALAGKDRNRKHSFQPSKARRFIKSISGLKNMIQSWDMILVKIIQLILGYYMNMRYIAAVVPFIASLTGAKAQSDQCLSREIR